MKSLAEDILEDIYLDGERAGIKKVVEWVEDSGRAEKGDLDMFIDITEWEYQKKEWNYGL